MAFKGSNQDNGPVVHVCIRRASLLHTPAQESTRGQESL